MKVPHPVAERTQSAFTNNHPVKYAIAEHADIPLTGKTNQGMYATFLPAMCTRNLVHEKSAPCTQP